MNRTVKNLFDHGAASMPVCMILIAGTLTKVGYPEWGLVWIAGLCAPLILADLSNFRGRDQAPLRRLGDDSRAFP